MSIVFPEHKIQEFQKKLSSHEIYSAIQDLPGLRIFMSHHVYSVWDFMSLVKFLQRELAPTTFPWKPRGHPSARRFINEIVIEEESDESLTDEDGKQTYASHFELYCKAMAEIGGNPEPVKQFVEIAATEGIGVALDRASPPVAAREFTKQTFAFIDTGKPHIVAAAFALGREHVIPQMFRTFLGDMKVSDSQAPVFHYYLNRHIHLDEDFHAPLSLLLLNEFCRDDPALMAEAVAAAEQAVEARLTFWDGVLAAIG